MGCEAAETNLFSLVRRYVYLRGNAGTGAFEGRRSRKLGPFQET
jgi:hypothetical protein